MAVASEHPAHAKEDAQYDPNNMQPAKSHDGLRGMETHIRPFVDENEDDAGDPAQHIARAAATFSDMPAPATGAAG